MSFLNGTSTRTVNGVKVETTRTDDYSTYSFPDCQEEVSLMQSKDGNDYVISGSVFSPGGFDVVRKAFPHLGFEWHQVGARVEFDSRVAVGNSDEARAALVRSMELV